MSETTNATEETNSTKETAIKDNSENDDNKVMEPDEKCTQEIDGKDFTTEVENNATEKSESIVPETNRDADVKDTNKTAMNPESNCDETEKDEVKLDADRLPSDDLSRTEPSENQVEKMETDDKDVNIVEETELLKDENADQAKTTNTAANNGTNADAKQSDEQRADIDSTKNLEFSETREVSQEIFESNAGSIDKSTEVANSTEETENLVALKEIEENLKPESTEKEINELSSNLNKEDSVAEEISETAAENPTSTDLVETQKDTSIEPAFEIPVETEKEEELSLANESRVDENQEAETSEALKLHEEHQTDPNKVIKDRGLLELSDKAKVETQKDTSIEPASEIPVETEKEEELSLANESGVDENQEAETSAVLKLHEEHQTEPNKVLKDRELSELSDKVSIEEKITQIELEKQECSKTEPQVQPLEEELLPKKISSTESTVEVSHDKAVEEKVNTASETASDVGGRLEGARPLKYEELTTTESIDTPNDQVELKVDAEHVTEIAEEEKLKDQQKAGEEEEEEPFIDDTQVESIAEDKQQSATTVETVNKEAQSTEDNDKEQSESVVGTAREEANVADQAEATQVEEKQSSSFQKEGSKIPEISETTDISEQVEDKNDVNEMPKASTQGNLEAVAALEGKRKEIAVIEIDDENEDGREGKQPATRAVEESKSVEEAIQPTPEEKTTTASNFDIIEIDDDEDSNIGVLKIDESKQSEETEETVKDDETTADAATKEPDAKISKIDEATTFAKMHTMPMIFYKKECINFECPKTHMEFHRAPQFALNYFKISKKKIKNQYICGDCYDETLNFYQEFCGVLEAKQPIMMKSIANKKQEFVEILDSSDEEENETADIENKELENPSFSKADLDLIELELNNSIRSVFDNVEIQNQLTWTKTIFTERVKKLQEELEYIDAELGETQKIADRMYNDLYDSGKYRINTLKPLDLDSETSTEPIPPLGEVERPPIKLGSIYYAARNKAIGCWIPCKVNEQVDNYLFVPHYRIKFLNTQFQPFKNISAKLIAYYDPPSVRLAVGQRVIAYFDGSTLPASDKEKNLVKSAFYPGIIAEEMKPNNFYRYLIFYDDGYTQYVSHKDVRLVCHVARNVWEDVDHVSREFIKKYVQEYRVNRPMVQTHKGQKMTTEKNGRWVPARVIDIDCSLVRMQFEGPKGNHTEWIYRGSLRLNPVYVEYQKSKNNQANNRMTISRLPRRTEPFIRYTDDEESLSAQQQQQQQHQQHHQQHQQQTPRTLNRSNSTSSTASSTTTPTVRHLNANTIYLEDEKPKGKVIYYTAKRQMPTRVYRPHECGSHCLIVIPHNLNGYNPLAKPLLSGWERLFSRQKIKKTVYYRAPCGKMFRNMRELHHYLRLTKCSLNVDNFDFYAETSCLAEFEAENINLKKRDISNGQEKIPLPLINYYDDTLPECTYSAKVIPTEGVNINTDADFLICCDCEDDCVDKSKCACWQLTVEGVKTINPDAQTDDIGYIYKRLYDHLPTGIYECNSRCKCKSHCLNRVVQHSLGLKLQVFKTTNRGWGLRCMNDIPRGSFVCVYAGNLLTEAKANEGGLDAGDEYFAELDYIETVEQLKEGYESDVEAPEEDDEDSYEPEPEDDVDFQPSRSFERRARRGTASGGGGGNNEGERQAINFNPKVAMEDDSKKKRHSVRQLFGKEEAVYVMDAKVTGNLGRYFNHSCSPNLFVQNVFVDTHDIRFPCVAFFSLTHIRAGTELTWNYNYEVGVVPGKVLYCQCGAPNCRQRLL